MTDEVKNTSNEIVGFMSRIDYGSPGFRRGLIEAAYEVFQKEGVHFIVLQGGLISQPAFKEQLKGLQSAKRKNAALDLMKIWAEDLANIFPTIQRPDGRPVKLYMFNASAPNYDGDIGKTIANMVASQRKGKDIFVRGREGTAEFKLQRQERSFICVLPHKGAWAQEHYSNIPERLVREEKSRRSHGSAVLWVSDCNASALARPGKGELPEPYITIPGLHKIQHITTNENQVGVRIVEFVSGNGDIAVRTYNFRDMIANEYRDIALPVGLDPLQVEVFRSIQNEGPLTIGQLEDAINKTRVESERVTRRGIANKMHEYSNKKIQPPIEFDESSGEYNFSQEWLRKEVGYKMPQSSDLLIESMLAFGCLHAGSRTTNYNFFVNDVPRLILRHDCRTLVGAGDFIEGLKHELMLRGEVFGGLNYTQQEELAALLVCEVMVKVFKVRFEGGIASFQKRKPSADELTNLVESALIRFLYWFGNHDEWERALGFTPLEKFRDALRYYLLFELEKILTEKDLTLRGLSKLIVDHIVLSNEHNLESGITLSGRHPHMARAQTSSLRLQHALREAPAPLVIAANFHVAIAVERWEKGTGQRAALQVGTMKRKTDFEESKLKRLDTGVGILKVWLEAESKHIFKSETLFSVTKSTKDDLKREQELSSDAALGRLLQGIGIKLSPDSALGRFLQSIDIN